MEVRWGREAHGKAHSCPWLLACKSGDVKHTVGRTLELSSCLSLFSIVMTEHQSRIKERFSQFVVLKARVIKTGHHFWWDIYC